MLRHEVQELVKAHTKMQQTVARLSDNAEALATAQAANARYKKYITEQDARALRIEDQHKQYVEGVGKSFVCMQNDMQAFVVQMTDNVNEQILHAKEDIDTNKKFLAERDAGHKDYVRELTESFEARLAEQTKASQLAEMHTRSQLDLVSQELLGFKQGMCLPLAVSESLDSEALNIFDESDERAETVESINAFLEPFQDSLDDEIGQVLAAAACGQKRSVDNGAAAGLCAFELQAIVYPQAGDALFTSKTGKSLAGQQAGAQARERQAAWSPPPRECVLCALCFVLCALCFVLCALCFVLCACISDLTRALSTYRALQVQGRRQRFLQVQEQLLQVAGGNLRDLHG